MNDIAKVQEGAVADRGDKPRVIIVGGGLAGLVASLFAAREGAAVTLMEGASDFGGRAQTAFEEGFAVNMGPHALYNTGAAKRALDELGVSVTGGMPRARDYRAFVGETGHLLPMDLGSIWRTSLFSLADKWAFTRFFGKLPKLRAADYVGVPVEEMLQKLVPAAGARACLHAVIRLTTYSDAPKLMCGGAVIDQLHVGMGSVQYLDGGWQQMVDALVHAAQSLGVTLLSGHKVSAVARREKGFSVVSSKRQLMEADAVVLALGPKQAAALAGDLAPELASHAERAVPVRAACLDVGVSQVPNAAATFGLGVDAPMYFSNHAAVAAQAPLGGGMFHAAKYLDPAKTEKPGVLEPQLERFLNLSQPGWKKYAVVRHFRPGMLVSNWLPLASDGGVAARPAVETSAPGLYLAGDWVGAKGLLSDASAASGRHAGRLAAGVGSRQAVAAAAE